jgi:Zn-dependent M28 family amino/carboxypeptidase
MPEEVLFIRSDQYPFVKQGVPAVFFVTGFTSSDPSIKGGEIWRDFLRNHYHQPSDQIDLPFHDESVVAFTLANYLLIRSIADDPVRPTWNRGDFFGDLFGGSREGHGTRQN